MTTLQDLHGESADADAVGRFLAAAFEADEAARTANREGRLDPRQRAVLERRAAVERRILFVVSASLGIPSVAMLSVAALGGPSSGLLLGLGLVFLLLPAAMLVVTARVGLSPEVRPVREVLIGPELTPGSPRTPGLARLERLSLGGRLIDDRWAGLPLIAYAVDRTTPGAAPVAVSAEVDLERLASSPPALRALPFDGLPERTRDSWEDGRWALDHRALTVRGLRGESAWALQDIRSIEHKEGVGAGWWSFIFAEGGIGVRGEVGRQIAEALQLRRPGVLVHHWHDAGSSSGG